MILGKWQAEGMEYLGIKIFGSNAKMVERNITPILKRKEDQCKIWSIDKLSWLGKIAAIKMILLPKLVFMFLNTIMEISDKLF